MRKNYYLVLGVPRTESASGIRAAFRALVKRYHPERIGEQGSRFFQDLLHAYQVLSDPEKRRLYDQGLCHAAGEQQQEPPEAIIVDAGAHAMATMPMPVASLRRFATVSPPHEQMRARLVRNFMRPSPSDDGTTQSFNVQLILSPDEALTGGVARITIPVFYPCHACGGSGQDWLFPCSLCEAQGMLEEEETVCVQVPPSVGDYTLVETPVRGLGLHNMYVCLYIRVLA